MLSKLIGLLSFSLFASRLSPHASPASRYSSPGTRHSLLVTAVLILAAGAAFAAGEVKITGPDEIAFKSDANIPGVAIALVAGNPKEGAYTIRAKFSPGVRIPAHFHPDERVVTVIAGTYWFGAGDKAEDAALKGYGPGTVIVVPAGAPHFSACKDGEAVVQESGVGPTGITIIK
jgi:quercetin dioxygenase-like cupin family protein